MSSWGVWAALLWLASSPETAAEPALRQRVALLCVVLPQGEPPIGRAEIETITAERVAARPQLELARSEESFSLGMDDPLRVCGSETSCLARSVRQLRAHIGLIVIVDASTGNTRMSLRSFESEEGAELASKTFELNSTEEVRARLGPSLASLLDEMGYPEAASLDVRASPPEINLVLEPSPPATSPGARHFFVAPGRYKVLATLEGYESKVTEVDLRAGQIKSLDIELVEEGSLLGEPWFWIALGGAAVMAGAIVGVSLATRDEQWCFSGSNRSCPD